MANTQQRAVRAVALAAAALALLAGPARAQVTDAEVLVGMCAPFSGVAKELGTQLKIGLDVAFAQANEAGGVAGRKVRLLALDDAYDPARTATCMKELVEKRKVFAMVGNVGTATAAVAVPYANEKGLLFFGALTGSAALRNDPPDRYVFNYRASYAEETAAIVRYLVDVKRIDPMRIAVFARTTPSARPATPAWPRPCAATSATPRSCCGSPTSAAPPTSTRRSRRSRRWPARSRRW